jgi:hypothetical protein
MQIRIRSTGQVMYGEEFNRTICTLPITPELLEQYGADPVFEGPQATTTTPYQISQYAGVEQIDGKWFTKYVVGPIFTDRPATETEPAMTAAEQEAAYKAQKDAEQAKNVRQQRNDKLKDCDWVVIKALEAGGPQDFAWAAYRQALRDITAQPGFPWTIDWPVAP